MHGTMCLKELSRRNYSQETLERIHLHFQDAHIYRSSYPLHFKAPYTAKIFSNHVPIQQDKFLPLT